jgi:hypothetical protein
VLKLIDIAPIFALEFLSGRQRVATTFAGAGLHRSRGMLAGMLDAPDTLLRAQNR